MAPEHAAPRHRAFSQPAIATAIALRYHLEISKRGEIESYPTFMPARPANSSPKRATSPSQTLKCPRYHPRSQ
ncbi:hypothetical protein BV25DRAFT_1825891 [Artomyces pyxidatus]|uniref:Uncharacterized protein n=1 Tax=Artomyces pyxidatus TaxID=48021 RepID=A0ACB8SZS2_9AGAM|nr:hypothetical protein BV25DRAFT_1825891 [Artomyces pyxidatus]